MATIGELKQVEIARAIRDIELLDWLKGQPKE